MIDWNELAAGAALVALLVYAVTGGADYGAGIWLLLARGERGRAQRELVDQAIAPIWEANHVWLVLVVVLLFVCFPLAFATASIALHVPLTLMLVSVVMRGAGFTFRHYAADRRMRRRWSRAFGIASAAAPCFLGIALGAVTAERIELVGWAPRRGFVGSWLHPFALDVGLLAAALFAMLAAVYLANEAAAADLRRDFARRAIAAELVVGGTAFGALALARGEAPRFLARLLGSPWSVGLQALAAVVAIALLATLARGRVRLARVLAIAQVAVVIGGWGVAQHPLLVAPRLTIAAAAAPASVVRPVMIALAAGALLLAPSFVVLFAVFKRAQGRP